jgi:hypothetical protein
MFVLAALVLAECLISPVAGDNTAQGAPECPCLEAGSPLLAAAASSLQAYPAGYGQGCRAHDAGLTLQGCQGKRRSELPYYCSASWCYVDPERCRESKDECERDGGVLGSHVSVACRSRDMSPSNIAAGSATEAGLYYSYETCGYQNKYDDDYLLQRIAGRHMDISALVPVNPWTYDGGMESDRARAQQWANTDGVLIDIVDKLLQTPTPPVNFSFSRAFASTKSREQYPLSAYTACCLDTLVGATDLCLSDFWITNERLAMGVTFLYPYDTDQMFLVASNEDVPAGVGEILLQPWLPFTGPLWAMIVIYVFILNAIVSLITDLNNTNDFHEEHLISRFCKASWLSAMGFVSRSIKNTPKSTAARIASFGESLRITIT